MSSKFAISTPAIRLASDVFCPEPGGGGGGGSDPGSGRGMSSIFAISAAAIRFASVVSLTSGAGGFSGGCCGFGSGSGFGSGFGVSGVCVAILGFIVSLFIFLPANLFGLSRPVKIALINACNSISSIKGCPSVPFCLNKSLISLRIFSSSPCST